MRSQLSVSDPRRLAVGVVLAAVCSAGGASTITAQTQMEGTTSAVKHVNCDGGQSLAHAVKHAKEGQTIRISGTCHERVPIATPRLTLAGVGAAVIDGTGIELGADPEFDGLLVIDGVTGVTITGLTIQNASGNGVLAQRGAAFSMHDTLVQDNAVTGIVVLDHSAAELTNCVTQRNRLGLDVVTSSSAVLKGTFSSSQNGNGVDINGTSIVELRGARVELNQNGGYGLIAASGSQVAIFGWQASEGSWLTANGNGFAGLVLGADSVGVRSRRDQRGQQRVRTLSQRWHTRGTTQCRRDIPSRQQHGGYDGPPGLAGARLRRRADGAGQRHGRTG